MLSLIRISILLIAGTLSACAGGNSIRVDFEGFQVRESCRAQTNTFACENAAQKADADNRYARSIKEENDRRIIAGKAMGSYDYNPATGVLTHKRGAPVNCSEHRPSDLTTACWKGVEALKAERTDAYWELKRASAQNSGRYGYNKGIKQPDPPALIPTPSPYYNPY